MINYTKFEQMKCLVFFRDIDSKKQGFFVFRENYTFLKSDEVHLTPVGNDIFLNILQGAIEYFMSSNLGGLSFPTHNMWLCRLDR
jgi:hypothetical protein